MEMFILDLGWIFIKGRGAYRVDHTLGEGTAGVGCTLGEGTSEVGCTLGEVTVGVDCTLGDGTGVGVLFVCGAVARRMICDIWMNALEVGEPYVRPGVGDVDFCKIASMSMEA
jgi:hypothetical protein